MLLVHKPVGITPLQCVKKVKDLGYFKDKSVTYAGRLDPMAQGLLLLVAGGDLEEKRRLMSLDKIYEVDVLFNLCSDSLDVLGVVEMGKCMCFSSLSDKVHNLIGTHKLPLPEYSSRNIARFGFGGINSHVDYKNMQVYSCDVISSGIIETSFVIDEIKKAKSTLEGNFRFDEILASWQSILGKASFLNFSRLRMRVSSGSYIRSIVKYYGGIIGVPCVAYNINRVKIGGYDVVDVWLN